jgi:hypothetical protein
MCDIGRDINKKDRRKRKYLQPSLITNKKIQIQSNYKVNIYRSIQCTSVSLITTLWNFLSTFLAFHSPDYCIF